MKEVLIEPQPNFVVKIKCSLEVVVSTKNLISDDEIEQITRQVFSRFESINVHVVVLRPDTDTARIKVDVKYSQESDLLLSSLELFQHYLGNVRVFQKRLEYRNVK